MKRKTKSGDLSAIYARLDAVRMSEADRANAKAALAQADAVADAVLAIGAFAKRLFSARPLHPTSAHS